MEYSEIKALKAHLIAKYGRLSYSSSETVLDMTIVYSI